MLAAAKRLGIDIPLPNVERYVSRAIDDFESGNWEDSVNQVAKAYEAAAYAVADLVVGRKAPRGGFGNAIKALVDRKLIDENTANTLRVENVGLWGWLCLKGRHAEGAGKGSPADSQEEARFALSWAGAGITFLGDVYLAWREESKSVST